MMREAGAGPTERILKRPIQLKESLFMRTVALVLFLAPWRVVVAGL